MPTSTEFAAAMQSRFWRERQQPFANAQPTRHVAKGELPPPSHRRTAPK